MEQDRENFERAVRATCAPRRRTVWQWMDDNAMWLIIFGWAAIVAVLSSVNDLMRMLER
ncbi:MAG: hypothetical protein IJ146_03195 [Kiritimatiellae bacterium]|nr:hypothetical protein [Kiritimatiellia bacterium]